VFEESTESAYVSGATPEAICDQLEHPLPEHRSTLYVEAPPVGAVQLTERVVAVTLLYVAAPGVAGSVRKLLMIPVLVPAVLYVKARK
jgi:hypothetical protein